MFKSKKVFVKVQIVFTRYTKQNVEKLSVFERFVSGWKNS